MKKVIKDLIDSGCSVTDILASLKELRPDDIIRCESCNRRLADIDAGEIVIKCRCGEFQKNYIDREPRASESIIF